jgi:Resolvase, N terminal domain
MGHLLGYAHVSTVDQQPQLQIDALERVGCYRVFTETASGARTDRPTLAQVWTSCASATPCRLVTRPAGPDLRYLRAVATSRHSVLGSPRRSEMSTWTHTWSAPAS